MVDRQRKDEQNRQLVPADKINLYNIVRDGKRDPPSVGLYDPPTRDYRVNLEWAKHITGAVAVLAEWSAWTGPEDERNDAVQVILEYLIGDVTSMFDIRQSPTNNCIMQTTVDGGLTWDDAFDYSACQAQSSTIEITAELNISNEFNITQMTTYAGDIINIYINWEYGDAQDVDRDTALCYATRQWVDWVCATMIRLIDDGNTSADDSAAFFATLASTLGGLSLALAAFAIFPVAGLYAGLSLVGASIMVQIIGALDTTSSAIYEDEDAREEVVCLIYGMIVGVTPTYALWSDAASGTLSGNAEKIREAAFGMMQDETAFVNFMGLMVDVIDAATAAELSNNCAPCVWEHVFDFSVDAQGWVLDAGGLFSHGVYTPATGWQATDAIQAGGSYSRAVAIKITMAETTITNVEQSYDVAWGNYTNPANPCTRLGSNPNGSLTSVAYTDRPLGANPKSLVYHDPTSDETTIWLWVRTSNWGTAVYTGNTTILSVTVTGTGDNPFD